MLEDTCLNIGVHPEMTYSAEPWTFTNQTKNKLNAAQTWKEVYIKYCLP